MTGRIADSGPWPCSLCILPDSRQLLQAHSLAELQFTFDRSARVHLKAAKPANLRTFAARTAH